MRDAAPGLCNWGAVGRGVIGGFLTALLLSLLATLALSWATSPIGLLGMATVLVAWLSVAAAGFLAARLAGRAALLHGAVAGGLFLILAIAAGSFFPHSAFTWPALALRMLLACLVGSLGGILGLGV